jgi:hypothetical protein
MPETQPEPLGPKERISTLLKEYDTLRAEILSRINHRWQMLGLIGVIVSFISARDGSTLSLDLVPAYAMILLLFGLWLRSDFHLDVLSVRIAEIEKKVNEIAGETLLEWETRGARRLLFGRLRGRRNR